MSEPKPSVFIGSSVESLPVAQVLQELLHQDATVNLWNQGIFSVGDFVLDRLLSASTEFDFATFVFCADDTAVSRGHRYLIARDNVVLELGLFAGRVGRERSFIVLQRTSEPVKLPSDLQGIVPAAFDWPEGADFSNYQKLSAALGPVAQSIRVAMRKRGVHREALKPLSAGMIFVALCLRERGHSVLELSRQFQKFQDQTGRLLSARSVDAYALKAAKYACQCLEALGLAEAFGGDEYGITPAGQDLLDADKVRERFQSAYETYQDLQTDRGYRGGYYTYPQ